MSKMDRSMKSDDTSVPALTPQVPGWFRRALSVCAFCLMFLFGFKLGIGTGQVVNLPERAGSWTERERLCRLFNDDEGFKALSERSRSPWLFDRGARWVRLCQMCIVDQSRKRFGVRYSPGVESMLEDLYSLSPFDAPVNGATNAVPRTAWKDSGRQYRSDY